MFRNIGLAPSGQSNLPVQMVESGQVSIQNKLDYLGLPAEAIRVVSETKVDLEDGQDHWLFFYRDVVTGEVIWNREALISIVHEYHILANNVDHLLTGDEEMDAIFYSNKTTVKPEVALNAFINYITGLKYDYESSWRKDTYTKDDILYKSSTLTKQRHDELLAYNLAKRKRVPQRNMTCKRCNAKEVYLREVYSRSGDEGAVPHYECGQCSLKW